MDARSASASMVSRGRSRSRTGKRGRSVSTSRSRSRNPYPTRTWPYSSPSMGPYNDPFPAVGKALLRYSQSIKLDAAGGVPAHWLFRATSCFDPDYSGVGHQPYGFDTYASIYNHYKVDKSTITVNIGGNAANQVIGCSIVDDPAVSLDVDTIRETKGTRFMTCPDLTWGRSIQQTYNSNSVSRSGANLTANTGTNPPENTFFDVWQTGMTGTADPAGVVLIISISYFVSFWELKDLGQS